MSSLFKIVVGVTAVLFGSAGHSEVFAADSLSRAALLASMCSTCHGTNGVGAPPIPRIAGQNAEYLFSVMKAFAEHQQPASIMDRHAQGYTDAELQLLAEYFSQQE